MLTDAQRKHLDSYECFRNNEWDSPHYAAIRAALATIADQAAEIARLRPEIDLLRRCVANADLMREYCCGSDACQADWCVAWREWTAKYGDQAIAARLPVNNNGKPPLTWEGPNGLCEEKHGTQCQCAKCVGPIGGKP